MNWTNSPQDTLRFRFLLSSSGLSCALRQRVLREQRLISSEVGDTDGIWHTAAFWFNYVNAKSNFPSEVPSVTAARVKEVMNTQLLSSNRMEMFSTTWAFIRQSTRPSSVSRPSWSRSLCWSEKERTVYWPQFCGSAVSNFTARFLSALTIMDGAAVRERGHLATEPQSAPLFWQAWWMQADEHTQLFYYILEPWKKLSVCTRSS